MTEREAAAVPVTQRAEREATLKWLLKELECCQGYAYDVARNFIWTRTQEFASLQVDLEGIARLLEEDRRRPSLGGEAGNVPPPPPPPDKG